MVTAGLLCCLFAAADKDSSVFQDYDAHDGIIRRICAFAVTALQRPLFAPNSSGIDPIAGLGPPQLLAVLINKVIVFIST